MVVDKKLIDYVKNSLNKGIAPEVIKNKLTSYGWSSKDVDFAISLALKENPKESSGPKLWLIPLIFLVSLIIIGAFIYFSVGDSKSSETSLPEQEQQQTGQTQSSVIDCNTDLNCLIGKSKNCEPSKALFSNSVDFFGMLISSTASYEIKGSQESRCVLYLKTINQTIDFSDEFTQQALASGTTQEELDAQKAKANEQAGLAIGNDGLCNFNSNNNLVLFLQKQKDGTFSGGASCKSTSNGSNCTFTGDWTLAECNGTMFSSSTSVQ